MELIIGAMVQVCMGATTYSPEVRLFKRFQEYWELIDTAKYAADDAADLVEDID